ncbi:hypothetical protein UPYG_G00071260 [Umbra pygmaea]|uniref:Uncharacterized protein n=1 Tax=Umbra pygmaea TaxID=75934 RepID=A0ABD0XBW3_UMBPY
MASKRQQESGAEKRKKKLRDDAHASLVGSMLRYIQGGTHGQEKDADDEQPSTSSSGTHQPQPACRSLDSTTVASLDQPPSISSLRTDTEQRTTTSETQVLS